MVGFEVGLASVLAMLVLIYFGMYVPVVLALLSFLGVIFIRGDFNVATDLLVLSASKAIADFLFGVIPLFVLMGLLVGAADLARDTYQVANAGFRKLRGGLGVATVVANAIFRSEEHTSELQSLMRISYAVFCLKKKTKPNHQQNN